MKALIRQHENGTREVIEEPFNPWVLNNMAFLTGQEKDADGNPIKGDGWTLVEDYEQPQEDLENEGN